MTGSSVATPVPADAGGAYVVATKVDGKYVLQKKAKLRAVIQAKVGANHTATSFSLEDAINDYIGGYFLKTTFLTE